MSDQKSVIATVLSLVKFVVTLPTNVVSYIRDMRAIGLYEFTDCKGVTFTLVIADKVANDAVHNSQGHAAKEVVLKGLRGALRIDDQDSRFSVPEAAYLWNHPARGFRSVTRLRDADSPERREYLRFSFLA